MIFFEHKFLDSENKVAEFRAVQNEEVLGECTLVLYGDSAEVTKVSVKENNIFIIDGLLKAAFHLAGLRGYYIGRCNVESIVFCLERMNLNKTENGYENDIPSILMGSCGNCHK